MSWADEMDALDKLLLQADYPPEPEASNPEPVLPSTTNPHPNTTDARPVLSDGGQGKPCQDGGTNLKPSISLTPQDGGTNLEPSIPPTPVHLFFDGP